MISEGSRDTEDWNKGCWKFTFATITISLLNSTISVLHIFTVFLSIDNFYQLWANLISQD